MRRMNVQGELRRILARALAPVEVRVNVPAERPAELVTVRRRDGAAQKRVYEDSSIEVMCWAATEQRAFELMESVRDALAALEFADGFADVSEKTVRSDYDLVGRSPRWYGLFALKTYLPTTNS